MRCSASPSTATTRLSSLRSQHARAHVQRRGPGAPCGVRTEAGPVVQLTATTMHTFLEENARGLTIVDFLTTWCGPCKVMGHYVDKFSKEFTTDNIKFAKLDCGKEENKDIAVEMGIKSLPTFHFYKGSTKVAELTGAKPDQLRRLILKHAKEVRMEAAAAAAANAAAASA